MEMLLVRAVHCCESLRTQLQAARYEAATTGQHRPSSARQIVIPAERVGRIRTLAVRRSF